MTFELGIPIRHKSRPYHVESIAGVDKKGRPVESAIFTPNTDYFDINPDTRPAIVYANGWTAGRRVMGGVAAYAALRGRSAIVFDHHRVADDDEQPEIHKMETLKAVVENYSDAYGADQVDVVGHSEGGINSTLYTVDDIESGTNRVRSLTLVGPAGVLDLNAPTLVYRGAKEILSLVKPQRARHLGSFAAKSPAVRDYLSKNLGLSIAEIMAIANSHILADLQDLHAIDFPVGVIGCDDDKFFPGTELQAEINGSVPYARLRTNHVDWLVNRRIQEEVYRIQQQFVDPDFVASEAA